MSLIDNVLGLIDRNRDKKFNCIPISDPLPRFSNLIPGIKKSTYYCVTGTPGSAKTQFTDFLFLYHPFEFYKEQKVDFEIVYFSFELSKEIKILQGISKTLFTKHGLRLSPNQIQSIGTKLQDDQREKIEKIKTYFQDLESHITFYDDALTPSQILEAMLSVLHKNGDYDSLKKTYTPHNPDKYIIFVIDHISLIQPDPGQTLHQALAKFSTNNVFLRNRYGATIVNVHQQGAEGGVEKFTSKGDNIVNKLEPKLAGLADNRTLGRDYDIVLGLFSPHKHELDFYRGYKTKKFGDRCRFLSIIKNREGLAELQIGLYFDGAVGYFEELPKSDEFSLVQSGTRIENELLYEKYSKGLVGPLDPNRQRTLYFK